MQLQEFEFRSWDTKLKKMIVDCGVARSAFDPTEKGRFIIMQFTGLIDINGVKVFAGDLLDFAGISEREGMVVEYQPGGYVVDGSAIWDYAIWPEKNGWANGPTNQLDGLEVIGNIYKNRDMLKAWQIKQLGL